MKTFAFSIKEKKDISIVEDGWIFKMKPSNKLCFFYLESPVIKTITYSKGKVVRSYRYTIRGIGYIDDNYTYKGIAFFNFLERYLLAMWVFIGLSLTTKNIYAGILFAIMIYMFVLLFSTEDDDSNLRIAQKMCER